MKLSDEEVEKLAEKLIEKTQEKGHTFWIDPESHYNTHKQLDEILRIYNETTGSVRKFFIGLLIAGMFIVAAFPYISKKMGN